jgi:transcription elongation factor GreA
MQRQTPPETIALTPAGRAALEQELHHLRTEQVPALARRLAEAREDSATREEDAGLLELQEEQHRAGSRAVELDRLLSMAREIASSTTGVVALGSRVEIEGDGERDAFQLVDPHEANASEGRISVASPVGKALLGHSAGDDVLVPVPAGERRLRLVSLS